MACPYFMPVEKLEGGTWPHAARLPLGCGWSGQCTAPGHERDVPSQEQLQEFCNLGYAERCGRLPKDRKWDSIRFGARTLGGDGRIGTGWLIQIRYVCERDHRPSEHGTLEFDAVEKKWNSSHPDNRLQRMAECFALTYVEKKKRQGETAPVAS